MRVLIYDEWHGGCARVGAVGGGDYTVWQGVLVVAFIGGKRVIGDRLD